jgi:type II secretory pathway pseudopilin PulG
VIPLRRSSIGAATRTSGLSILELLLALGLFGVVAVKAALVLNSANDSYEENTAKMSLEDKARRTLDQIAYAIMGSDRETLFPEADSPLFTDSLEYSLSLGVDEDGNVIFDDPEEIGLSEDEDQVLWRKNPDTPEETRVAWCNVVRPFLEGELMNGDDDNENGIIDEKGLAFVMDRDSVTIRLSLECPTADGGTVTQTVETTITLRN